MNILIPDNWLRDFLQTKATPEQIKEYVSLCGPSVERIHKIGGEIVYDVEITSNRPDAMSVSGIAREAAAILPRFGIGAKFINDPYVLKTKIPVASKLSLTIKTDPKLNPRWTSIVLSGVKVGPSPSWLTKRLEATGIRPLNNVVDVTNYLMRAYGQPAHAFDYDEIKGGKMILRASKKGEKIVTLDGKAHKLPGEDIVITDGDGRLIDLCGIMGGYNSSIKNSTTNVVLFMQTYDPSHIRKTSMALAQRTEAAGLFEKGLDSELVMPAIKTGVRLMEELTGGRVASKLYDLYPNPYKQYTVTTGKEKIESFIGVKLSDKEIGDILHILGFSGKITKSAVTVTVPSWRRDVSIDVDIIEEIARIFGYHNIPTSLPSSEPPVVMPDPQLSREENIKTRLRDWGFTELYTYSMISEKLMDIFGLDIHKAYKIENPLSDEWVYMRPTLLPSMLTAIKENLKHTSPLRLFELSMVYELRKNNLPIETPMLLVAWTGHKYREAKGLAEALGIKGSVYEADTDLLQKIGINEPVTILEAPIGAQAAPAKKYIPIPKYPPVIEDFSFTVTPEFRVGPFMDAMHQIHTLITSVTLLDSYENKRTFRVTYLDPARTLTNLDIAPVHQKFLEYAAEKFSISPVI
jgi:phenylalanyl-tRNA synthetase beta chain